MLIYFSKALFEGLICHCGGAYTYIRRGLTSEGNLRFKLDRASLTVGSKFTIFSLFYVFFRVIFQVQAPGALIIIWRADLTDGFVCITGLGGLY